MKHGKSKRTENDEPTGGAEDYAANDGRYETDSERASSACYERRRKMWAEFNQGDSWFAVAVYLILSSVAFVIL